jgi:hypothetical protein
MIKAQTDQTGTTLDQILAALSSFYAVFTQLFGTKNKTGLDWGL